LARRLILSGPPLRHVFAAGTYHLNKKEAEDRFKNTTSVLSEMDTEILVDKDKYTSEDVGVSVATLWEWHGQVPDEDGWTEVVAAILTDRGAESPEDGVLVRLQKGTALLCGLRPYVYAQFTPLGQPYGLGPVEAELPLIHQTSKLIALAIDNAKIKIQAAYKVNVSSPAFQDLNNSQDGDLLKPGKIFKTLGEHDIEPLAHPNTDTNTIFNLISYLEKMLEKRTNVSDATLGLSQREKTASEAMLLEQASQGPVSNVVNQFKQTFLNPAGQIMLEMLREFTDEVRQITTNGPDGQAIVDVLEPDELLESNFQIDFVLDNQSHTNLARAQALERMLGGIMQLYPLMQQQGVNFDSGNYLRRMFQLLGLDKLGEIVTQMTPEQKEQMQQQQMMMQQAQAMAAQQSGGGNQGGAPPQPDQGPPQPNQIPQQPPMGPMGQGTDYDLMAQLFQEMARGPAQGMAPVGNSGGY
jgi:hypothetical protein